MINSGFFLKPSSLRKVDRRRFCGETEGVLLCLARFPRQTESAAKAAAEPKVNSPSVSAKNIAEPAPSHEQRAPLRAKPKDKSLFISFPTRKKSAFIRAADFRWCVYPVLDGGCKLQKRHRTGNRGIHRIIQRRASRICVGLHDVQSV